MEKNFSERVGIEVTITAPSDLAAHEVHEQLSIAKWTYEIGLMFEVKGKVLKIDAPILLEKKDGNAVWQVTFLFEITLQSFEPISEGCYDREGTLEYFDANLDLPIGFFQLLQSPFTIVG